ncbi:uncharacterized protein KD926_006378 [Aspergillus affinis]|uniref:uncharacterized protein n=1 Tax=Aspergillus affinis TaxID=1070780 RepID=UPI0022FDFDB0|nr:uncharacterized protein KD926_006378 [Aspergillus affinis]KAI9041833.1 hypothetical protein KD926_006378 [Aspergillus affinis]
MNEHRPTMTLTRGHSCILCQQRKVRCDQQKPCTNCIRAQAECKVAPPKPVKRRKKKLRRRELIERVRQYEALLTKHGVEFESVTGNEDEPASSDTEPDVAGVTVSEGEGPRECVCQRRDKSNHHVLDLIFNQSDGFPFMLGSSASTITHLHPPGVRIFQLWQVYINNVNPLLKLTHIPTLQSSIVEASVDPARASRPLEALMFCIYLITVKSMADEELTTTLGESKALLVARFNEACQQALSNAGLMKSNDLMVLQAFMLYLLSAGREVDTRTLSCWMGIAVRMAIHLSLHRDGYLLGLSPFETEQRRRLWWQLVALDERIAEITGSTVTILSSPGADCRLPSNLNDADLHPDVKEPPVPHTGATEMLFYLARMEVMIATASTHSKIEPPIVEHGQSPRATSDMGCFGGSSSRYPPFADLESFKRYMKSTYLNHCNDEIPLHKMASMTIHIGLCKVQLIDGLRVGKRSPSLGGTDCIDLLLCATRMLEYDTEIHAHESLVGFHWYTALFVPIEGYMILVGNLRRGAFTDGDDRAWRAICENYGHRKFIRHIQNPIHASFRDAVLDAWSTRKENIASRGATPEAPPDLIQVLQQQLGPNTVELPQNPTSGSQKTYQESDLVFGDDLNRPPLGNIGNIFGDEWLNYDSIF